jgi:hypothetical protein
MFIISDERKFTWPVDFHQVGEDGKRTVTSVKFQFRQIRVTEFAKVQRDLQTGAALGLTGEEALAIAASAYERFVLGWDSKAIVSADGSPFEFSRESLVQLLNTVGAGEAIMRAYGAATTGAGAQEIRRGN